MVRFGFHLPISGGFKTTMQKAIELECKAIQIFSRNPRGWNYPPLKQKEAEEFKKFLKENDIKPLVVHMPYLPNLASPDDDSYKRSIDSLLEELKRCAILNAEYVNIHVGKVLKSTEEEGLKRLVNALKLVLKTDKSKVMILLENTAGQGSEIGYRFEHFAYVFKRLTTSERRRVGVCLDTAHLFEAGYDLRNKKAIDNTLNQFDKIVGFSYLKLIHYNDSYTELGSRVDRHWHIGEGKIGKTGMKAIITHPELKNLPFIMETPKKTPHDDFNNLKTVKTFLGLK